MIARVLEVGETTTGVSGEGAVVGEGIKARLPGINPLAGSSGPVGGENLKLPPSGVVMESVIGLKVVLPE
jgi:hypothetical protein